MQAARLSWGVRRLTTTLTDPVADRILSLAEITALEDAAPLGGAGLAAPAFAAVLAALRARWRLPLRDAETAARLLFYVHEGHTQQPQYRGVAAEDLPRAAEVLAEAGGEAALPADALFGLALLLDWQAWPFGDEAEWAPAARRWAAAAAAREPESRLFREWPFFLGEAADTAGPRAYVAPEAHARYHGRGAFGGRVLHLVTAALFPPRGAGPAGAPGAA